MQQKKIIIAGSVIAILLIVGIFAFWMKSTSKPKVQSSIIDEEELDVPLEPVDASVVVKLEALQGKREMLLTAENFPSGTEEIEYEITYNTVGDIPQGLIGSLEIKGGSASKQTTVGTCSSGRCTYHQVSGPMKVFLVFSGSYGKRKFEKEFPFGE